MKSEHGFIKGLVNKYVAELGVYNAGLSIEELMARYKVERISKLGSNESPFPLSESVRKALSNSEHLTRYPDSNCQLLRTALAQKLAVDESSFVFGNGSEDLIAMICRAFINEGDKVMTVVPSFGLHILYPKACGAQMVIAQMTKDLSFDMAKIVTLLQQERPKLFFIASPSNPVGTSLNQQQVEQILASLPEETLLIFDEAYYEYAQGDEDYPDVLSLLQSSGKPFVLLRTFSKAYSLAGFRVGYGVFYPADLVTSINKVRTPFNVNTMAQVAAVAALEDDEHLNQLVDWNYTAREKVTTALQGLGLSPVPSKGNFVFFSTPLLATELAEKLLQKGVIIKPWMEEGYEHYVRVSIGSEEENQHFISSLAACLATKIDVL